VKIVFFCRRKKSTQTHFHIQHALEELGHEVRMLYYGRWRDWLGRPLADAVMHHTVRRFGAELVLVWKECISAPLLERLGETRRTVVVCVDYFPEPPKRLVELGRLADLLTLTSTGQLDKYRELGVRRPVCWLQGFDPAGYEPAGPQPADAEADVAFIGKPGAAERRELLGRLDREFKLTIWGEGWGGLTERFGDVRNTPILPGQYETICRASKVMIGRDLAEGVDLCFSNRLWLTLGCGGFLVTNYVPGFEALFENHKHLVWYKSPDECVELVRDYLGRPDDRRRIARAGCELVRSEHTYVHRARELVRLIEPVPAGPPEE
jgi:hypothetical protein